MTFLKLRGQRGITSSERTTSGYRWVLSCGHTLDRDAAPRLGQRYALCPTCRKASATCSEPERTAAAVQRVRRKRVARGLCRDCAAPVVVGRKQCAVHLAANREGTKRWKAKRRTSHQVSVGGGK